MFGDTAIQFGQKLIKRVRETKFLGVIIDEKLSWKNHIKYLGRKLASTVGSLWDMRRIINSGLRKSVYNALVNSHISYGISVWGSGASEKKLKPIFILQKKCLRNLFKIKRESKLIKGHTKLTFNENKILTVHNLYNYFTLTSIAKIRMSGNPEYMYNLLKMNIQNLSQRMYLPFLSTTHYQNNFLYQGPKLWNFILPFIKDKNLNLPQTIALFRIKVKRFLCEMQSYGTNDDWSIENFCMEEFIKKSKIDPYYCESVYDELMHTTTVQSLSFILET